MAELGAPVQRAPELLPPVATCTTCCRFLHRGGGTLCRRPRAAGAGYSSTHRPGKCLYYAQPHADMSEADFIGAVLAQSGCDLLLDVNNIYVNSVNHRYDALEFLDALPLERTRYIHVAGHFDEAPTSGRWIPTAPTSSTRCGRCWHRLTSGWDRYPRCLNATFNPPPLAELLGSGTGARTPGGGARPVAGRGA